MKASAIVAANVRELREAKRLTYVELSSLLSDAGQPIPVLGLRRIERGERRVDVDDLVALAAVFDLAPADLLMVRAGAPVASVDQRLSRLEMAVFGTQ